MLSAAATGTGSEATAQSLLHGTPRGGSQQRPMHNPQTTDKQTQHVQTTKGAHTGVQHLSAVGSSHKDMIPAGVVLTYVQQTPTIPDMYPQ
jgi:hypothetical protein